MRDPPVQQSCAAAFEREVKLPKNIVEMLKRDIMAKEHNTILLSMTDEVLREVMDQIYVVGI